MNSKLANRRKESKELKLSLKGLSSSQKTILVKHSESVKSTDRMRKSHDAKQVLSLSERRRASKQLKQDGIAAPMAHDRSPIMEDNRESLQTPQLECLKVRPMAMFDSKYSFFTPAKQTSDVQSTDESSKNSTPSDIGKSLGKPSIVFRTLCDLEKDRASKEWSKGKNPQSSAVYKEGKEKNKHQK